MISNETYIERLEQLISNLHDQLELMVYEVEDPDAAAVINGAADTLWDEFCSAKAAYYTE